MRMIFGLVLVAGVALAGGAVYMAKNYIGAYQAELARAQQNQQQVVPTQTIYVAKRQLAYGEPLKKNDVRAVAWPKTALPQGAFSDVAVLFPDAADEPRLILRPMEVDEPILTVKVTEPGEDIGLTTRLDKGMRAFAIRVDVASGVSGFLRPGDRVDVYWTGRVDTGDGGQDVTQLIDTAIRLIAVDQSDETLSGARIARTVTVSARPEQVAALAQAQSTGTLSLALVGIGDDTELANIQVDQMSLLGIEQALPAPRAEKKTGCSIRTRRGAEVVAVPIPCTN